jgi:hypothetical protein
MFVVAQLTSLFFPMLLNPLPFVLLLRPRSIVLPIFISKWLLHIGTPTQG